MITDRERHFMQLAIEESRLGVEAGHGGPFGCVVVKGDTVIARGHNLVLMSNDPTSHAEVVAIRKACEALQHFQLTGCELYCSCEPCPMCLGAIYWARPDRIFYANTKKDAAAIGFDDQFIYDELELPYADRSIPAVHMHDADAIKVFEAWKTNPGKKLY
ncbi:MAG TPA: nucleoside deaminase [Phnomibacter sp.]|nr:nucleoside deaminase [Phnomibacter sp.]